MQLLLDENLSRRIVPFIQELYPSSTQVVLIGLEQASDREIRSFAKDNGYVIVTRDSDFYEMSLLYGQPPKVIWLKSGNTGKAAVIKLLLDHSQWIEGELILQDKACIELY